MKVILTTSLTNSDVTKPAFKAGDVYEAVDEAAANHMVDNGVARFINRDDCLCDDESQIRSVDELKTNPVEKQDDILPIDGKEDLSDKADEDQEKPEQQKTPDDVSSAGINHNDSNASDGDNSTDDQKKSSQSKSPPKQKTTRKKTSKKRGSKK